MLSPTYLESLPVGIVDQYAELESYIIADIARRIAGAEYIMTPTAEWQIKKAQELRLSYDEIQTQVAKQLGKTKKEVKEIFKEAGVKAIRADASIHALAGKEKECTEFLNSLATNRVFQEGIKQTNGLMTNFCRSLASESNKIFGRLLDQAYFECQSGAFSQQSAIRKAVKQLGKQGITMIRYPSGHRETTEVAVRRAIITGTNITAARLQLDLAKEVGCDLVEVTSHFGARPSHQEWQGGVYSISGKHRKYESLEQATGYGTGEGLCGFNCRHNFYPFYEGISTPLGNPHDAKESNEFYELTQKQRALERNVRKSKREVEAYKAATQVSNDEALLSDLKKAKDKLADNNAKLRQFISEHEKLTLRRDRLMIGKGGSAKVPIKESKPKVNKTTTQSNVKPKVNKTTTSSNIKLGANSAKKNYENACKQVLDRGKINGNENLLLTNLNGEQVFKRLDGTNNCVKLTPEFMKFLDNGEKESLLLIHNHPKSSSFSDADMRVLNRFDSIKEITAYGHDGTLYKLSNNGITVSNKSIELDYEYFRWSLNGKYSLKVASKQLSEQEAWKQQSHEIIQKMSEKYGWTYTREVL